MAKHTYKQRGGDIYVLDVRYPSGAVGCVARTSSGWVVACVPALGCFSSRDKAADAEAAHVASLRANLERPAAYLVANGAPVSSRSLLPGDSGPEWSHE